MAKLKLIGLNALLYTVYFFGACVVTMLAEALLSFIVDKFVLLPYLPLTIGRVVIYTGGVIALVGFLGYKEGYREASAPVGETLLCGLLATLVPHLLFAMLFHFQSFVTGGVRYAVGLLISGANVTADSVLPTRSAYPTFLIVYVLYGLLYTGALTVCKYQGCRRRLADRMEMTGQASPDKTRPE